MADFNYADYLASLLIIQYANKQKATATIKALAKMFPADLILKIRDYTTVNTSTGPEEKDIFDIDVANGVMLDILGKYLGVNRYYKNEDDEIVPLTDDEYRILLKFKAISNTSNASHYEIDMAFYNFFGTKVRATSAGNMQMTIFVPSNASNVIEAAIQQKCLPTPLGVEANKIVIQDKRFFGFVNYKNQYAFYKTGFREYNDADKEGETLNYDKVEEVERQ